MRSIFVSALLAISAVLGLQAQTQINPSSQINWPQISGSGVPTTYCPTTTTGVVTIGTSSVVLSSLNGVAVNQTVVGTGIPASTTVTAVNTHASTVTLSNNATASGPSVSLSFYSYGMPYTDKAGNIAYSCGSGGWFETGGAGAGSPGGPTLSYQFNNSGTFNGTGAGTYTPGNSNSTFQSLNFQANLASQTGASVTNKYNSWITACEGGSSASCVLWIDPTQAIGAPSAAFSSKEYVEDMRPNTIPFAGSLYNPAATVYANYLAGTVTAHTDTIQTSNQSFNETLNHMFYEHSEQGGTYGVFPNVSTGAATLVKSNAENLHVEGAYRTAAQKFNLVSNSWSTVDGETIGVNSNIVEAGGYGGPGYEMSEGYKAQFRSMGLQSTTTDEGIASFVVTAVTPGAGTPTPATVAFNGAAGSTVNEANLGEHHPYVIWNGGNGAATGTWSVNTPVFPVTGVATMELDLTVGAGSLAGVTPNIYFSGYAPTSTVAAGGTYTSTTCTLTGTGIQTGFQVQEQVVITGATPSTCNTAAGIVTVTGTNTITYNGVANSGSGSVTGGPTIAGPASIYYVVSSANVFFSIPNPTNTGTLISPAAHDSYITFPVTSIQTVGTCPSGHAAPCVFVNVLNTGIQSGQQWSTGFWGSSGTFTIFEGTWATNVDVQNNQILASDDTYVSNGQTLVEMESYNETYEAMEIQIYRNEGLQYSGGGFAFSNREPVNGPGVGYVIAASGNINKIINVQPSNQPNGAPNYLIFGNSNGTFSGFGRSASFADFTACNGTTASTCTSGSNTFGSIQSGWTYVDSNGTTQNMIRYDRQNADNYAGLQLMTYGTTAALTINPANNIVGCGSIVSVGISTTSPCGSYLAVGNNRFTVSPSGANINSAGVANTAGIFSTLNTSTKGFEFNETAALAPGNDFIQIVSYNGGTPTLTYAWEDNGSGVLMQQIVAANTVYYNPALSATASINATSGAALFQAITDVGSAAASGHNCLQIDTAGVISNTGSACGSGGGGGGGTVTSIATTGPITGGTITASGTIACATCVTSAASLTSTAFMTGGGSQASQTPSATSTLDASGNAFFAGTLGASGHVTLEGVTSTGATGTGKLAFSIGPAFTGTVDASGATQFKLPVLGGFAPLANGEVGYDTTNLNWQAWDNGAASFVAMFPVASPPTSGHVAGFLKSTNSWSLQDLGAPATGTVTSIATTGPITGGPITATGTIACATCVTSSAALTSGAAVFGSGGGQGTTTGNGDLTYATHTLTVGTSGILTFTGGGVINADQINGATVPLSAAVLGSNGSGQAIAATPHQVTLPLQCSDTSVSATTYTCSTTPTLGSLTAGDTFIFTGINQNNSGSATLNINSIGAKTLKKWQNSASLAAGDLQASGAVRLTYDGTFLEVDTIGNAPAGTISGSGTTNYYALWSSSSALTSGHLDDGVTTASTITSTEGININAGGSSAVTIGTAGSATGTLTLESSTATGGITITPASAASQFTITVPAVTDTLAVLNNSQTFAGNETISTAGTASNSPLFMTGAPYTGGTSTTNWPLLYLSQGLTAVTSWASGGTEIGINQASGGTADFLNFYVNNSNKFKVSSTGSTFMANVTDTAITVAGLVGTNSSGLLAGATGHNVAQNITCADSSGSGTAQVCSTSPTFTPAAGDWIIYTTTTPNSGAGLTLNVNSLGVKSVAKWQGTTTLAANDVLANKQVPLYYDGTNWELAYPGNPPSTGTVTSIATTGPITGGTITATGTIACATCVTSAASLTSTAIMTGGGSQASQTPSTTSTLDASGNASFAGTLAATGHVTFEGVTSTGATGTAKLVFSASPAFTGTPDASGATQFKLPIAASGAAAANGEQIYDTTNLNWHVWQNAADNFMAVFPVASPPTSGHITGFLKSTNSWSLQDLGAIGTAAAANTGTSGANVPLLNGTNTWSGNQTLTGHIIMSSHDVAIPRVCADTSASSTAQVCNTSPTFTPAAGDEIIYTTTTANTGTGLTLNVNSLGAKSVAKWQGTTTLAANDVLANKYVLLTYDGTNWEAATIGNAPSGGTPPCTGTANSIQYNNGGAFGCVADLTYSTHTISAATTAILDLSPATGTAAFKVPSNTTNTATAAGVIDFDTTNKNYHGFVNGGDALFLNSAAALTTNVVPKAVISSGNMLITNSTITDSGTVVSTTEPFTTSYTGTASQSALYATGAPYTGGTATTNFPLVYINDGTGPTTFSTAGTEFGINTPNAFTGNLIDAHVNGGVSVFNVTYTGAHNIGSGAPSITPGSAAVVDMSCGTVFTGVQYSAGMYCGFDNLIHVMSQTTDVGAVVTETVPVSNGYLLMATGSGTTQAQKSTVSDNNGYLTTTDIMKGVNTVILSADSANIVATTAATAVTQFTWGALSPNVSYAFDCHGTYTQATAAGGVSIAIQGATNAPTDIDAWGTIFTTNPASTTVAGTKHGTYGLATTTYTNVVTATPSATATQFEWELHGTLAGAINLQTTLNIGFYSGSASDAVVIKRGSFCTIHP